MDSQDSSGLSHHHHHQHQQHQQHQHQQHQHQHHPQPPPVLQHIPNNSYNQLPNTNNSIMHHQNPPFPFNSMAASAAAGPPKPLDHHLLQSDGTSSGGGGGGGGFSTEPARKRRGRPRKYSPDSSIGLGLSPAPMAGMAHTDSGGGRTQSSENNATKRNRGRPPGSVKKQLNALGVPGVGFTPHVITVNAGEDIALKIMAFSQQGPRTVLILSANGAVCNVTLRQPSMTGGVVTYEGRFEIISLSGSFLPSENNGNRDRTGGLSVSLAASDGKVLGGGVAGMLKAASPVQVVVGSFIADGKKPKSEGPSSTPPMLNFGGPAGGNSPSPGGASSESGEENEDSPPAGPYGNASQPAAAAQNMQMYSNMGYPMKMLPN